MHILRQGHGGAVEEDLHGCRADIGDDQGKGPVGAGMVPRRLLQRMVKTPFEALLRGRSALG